jgi:hypothetical protein
VSVESLILEAYKGGSDRYDPAEDDLVLDDDMQYSMCAGAGEHFCCGLMVVHHELDLLVLAERGAAGVHRSAFRTTSLSPDHTSVTAQTFTSTKPIGNATSRMTFSVTSVGTLAAFFGHADS